MKKSIRKKTITITRKPWMDSPQVQAAARALVEEPAPLIYIPSVDDRLLAARNALVMLMAAGTIPNADSMIVDDVTLLEAIRTTARDAYEHVLSVSKVLDGRTHNLKAPAAPMFQTIDAAGRVR